MKEFLNRLSGQQENRFDLQETTNPQMESVLQELDALEASGNFGAYQLDADAATALATEMLGISLEQYQLIQAEAQAIATNGSSIKEQVADLLTVLNKKDVLPRLSPATSVLVMLLLTTTLIACSTQKMYAQTEDNQPTQLITETEQFQEVTQEGPISKQLPGVKEGYVNKAVVSNSAGYQRVIFYDGTLVNTDGSQDIMDFPGDTLVSVEEIALDGSMSPNKFVTQLYWKAVGTGKVGDRTSFYSTELQLGPNPKQKR